MSGDGDKNKAVFENLTLGEYLKRLREVAGKTLREIEEKAEVSNAYLSQLENGKVARPSPRILHKLAKEYGTSYENLMAKAGYLKVRDESGETRVGALPTLERQKVTREEEEALVEYLAFLRSRKPRGK